MGPSLAERLGLKHWLVVFEEFLLPSSGNNGTLFGCSRTDSLENAQV